MAGGAGDGEPSIPIRTRDPGAMPASGLAALRTVSRTTMPGMASAGGRDDRRRSNTHPLRISANIAPEKSTMPYDVVAHFHAGCLARAVLLAVDPVGRVGRMRTAGQGDAAFRPLDYRFLVLGREFGFGGRGPRTGRRPLLPVRRDPSRELPGVGVAVVGRWKRAGTAAAGGGILGGLPLRRAGCSGPGGRADVRASRAGPPEGSAAAGVEPGRNSTRYRRAHANAPPVCDAASGGSQRPAGGLPDLHHGPAGLVPGRDGVRRGGRTGG